MQALSREKRIRNFKVTFDFFFAFFKQERTFFLLFKKVWRSFDEEFINIRYVVFSRSYGIILHGEKWWPQRIQSVRNYPKMLINEKKTWDVKKIDSRKRKMTLNWPWTIVAALERTSKALSTADMLIRTALLPRVLEGVSIFFRIFTNRR